MSTKEQRTRSTRIYTPTEYGSSYSGSAKEVGFQKIEALDQSKAIKNRAQQNVDNITALATAAERQGNLDAQTLKANQGIQSAQFNANWATVKGLLSLTKTGIQAAELAQEQKEAFNMATEVGFQTEAQIKTSAIEDVQIKAENKAINETNNDLVKEGGIDNKAIGHQLKENSTYNLTKGIKGSVLSAATIYQTYIDQRIKNIGIEEFQRDPIAAAGLIKKWNQEFFVAAGLNDKRLIPEINKTLAPIIINSQGNFVKTMVEKGIEWDQSQNLLEAQNFVSTLVNSDKSISDIWTEATERYANGNAGYNGYAEGNPAALKQLLAEAEWLGADGIKLINSLKNVQQVPGQKGTELSKTYGDKIFDQAIRNNEKNSIDASNRKISLRKAKRLQIVDSYYDNPTPQGKLDAINALQDIGDPDSLALALKLSQTGIGYDPDKAVELGKLQAKGVELDPTNLKMLLDNGTISQDEYTSLKDSGPFRQSKKDLNDTLDKLDLESALSLGIPMNELRNTPLGSIVEVKALELREDIYSAVLAEIRVDPTLTTDKKELLKVINEKKTALLQTPAYKATPSATGQLTFGETTEMSSEWDVVGASSGTQNFSKLSYEDLFEGGQPIPLHEIDANKDYLFSKDDLQLAVERWSTDRTFSDNFKKYAKSLNLSPLALLNAQLKRRGKPNIHKLTFDRELPPPNFDNADNTFKFLTSQAGLPWEGAAYFAVSLNAGEKEVGENGLIQWTVGDNTEARVAAIEKHYGKSVKEITEAEQVSYKLLEIKISDNEAYKTLMNPNSSTWDLKAALVSIWNIRDPESEDAKALFEKAESLIKRGSIY